MIHADYYNAYEIASIVNDIDTILIYSPSLNWMQISVNIYTCIVKLSV